VESDQDVVRQPARSRTGRRAGVPAWALRIATALLTAAAVVALMPVEHTVASVALTAARGWVLALAVPLVLAAAMRRQRVVAAVALGLSVMHVAWLTTSYHAVGPRQAPAGTATMTLLSANLRVGNPALDAVAAALYDSGADVVCLQEVTPEHLAGLQAAGLAAAYPHSVTDALPGFHGSAIFSKLPLTSAGPFDVQGSPMTAATVRLGGRSVRIVDVHVVAPLSGTNLARWRRQLAEMAAMAPADGQAMALVGDFNATAGNRSLAGLLAAGWRDAFAEAGRGFGFTYPNGAGVVPPPLLRLDHVLVSEPITVTRAETAENPGSDHRMLAVDIAVPTAS
jgi:endonuclease/exonuclease/phosphatase (EEP) superfamily protein YafD